MAIISAFILFAASAGAQEVLFKVEKSAGQALIDALKIDKPLTFCSENVPLNEAEIKERLERELLYALDNNDDVVLWLKRANRYFSHIEKVLKKNSMPDDLKYITIAESALRPLAASNKEQLVIGNLLKAPAPDTAWRLIPILMNGATSLHQLKRQYLTSKIFMHFLVRGLWRRLPTIWVRKA